MTVPDGPGPHPLVLFSSGCSGYEIPGDTYGIAQKRLTAAGFAVARVDSLKPAKSKRCSEQMVSSYDQEDDIKAVAKHFAGESNIDGNRISLIGWSWGGRTAVHIAQKRGGPSGINKAIAYYPLCKGVKASAIKLPAMMFFAGLDDVVTSEQCQAAATVKPGADVQQQTYPEARHAFDNPHFVKPTAYSFGTLGYNKAAAADAWNKVMEFLKP